jgi:acetolactate synthase-1/3 small subunit
MTFVVRGTQRDLQQVKTQLDKLINVIGIADVTNEATVTREMALIKVCSDSRNRGDIMQLVDIYRATVVDVDMESLIIQIVGPVDRIDSLIRLLENFGIEEMVRTGSVSMVRGAKFSAPDQPEPVVVAPAVAGNGRHA